MNNFFNPFDDYDNKKIQQKEKVKQNKVNNLKPYTNSTAQKYLCNTNSNKPNILNIIKTSKLSDEYSIKIIKHLYNNIKDESSKQLLKEFFFK